MRTAFVVVLCSTLWVAVTPALAQQKTAQACRDEWRANRAAYEAAGTTLKAHMYKCQAGGAAAPAGTPASPATPAPVRGQTSSK